MSNRMAKLLAVMSVSVTLTGAVVVRPVVAAPNDACAQALRYEKASADNSMSPQQAYDATVAGLDANKRCADAQEKLVNEAYLLSMRAPAEQQLRIGDWQRDFSRANMLLMQCTNWPGLKGTRAAIDCDTQRRYNLQYAKTATAPAASSPLPSASPHP